MMMNNTEVILDTMIQIVPMMARNFLKGFDRDMDIVPAHLNMMLLVKRFGPLSMTDIAKKLDLSAPNLTVLSNKIVEKGYLRRMSDPDDRRIVMLAITEKGEVFLNSERSRMSEIIQQKIAVLNKEEVSDLIGSLNRVSDLLVKVTDHKNKKS